MDMDSKGHELIKKAEKNDSKSGEYGIKGNSFEPDKTRFPEYLKNEPVET